MPRQHRLWRPACSDGNASTATVYFIVPVGDLLIMSFRRYAAQKHFLLPFVLLIRFPFGTAKTNALVLREKFWTKTSGLR